MRRQPVYPPMLYDGLRRPWTLSLLIVRASGYRPRSVEHITTRSSRLKRRLIQEIQSELADGGNVQVFAVYTQKRDVTRRLKDLLRKEGIRAAVLTAETPPEQREAW